jgi:hypothetical protein
MKTQETRRRRPAEDPKVCKKLVPFDSLTSQRLDRAARALGLPITAFIRLAVHGAFEQLLEIYFEVVDAAAQGYVERYARGFFRTKGNKNVPRFGPDDGAYLNDLIKRASSLQVRRSDALEAVADAFKRPIPRKSGPLKLKGSPFEQRLTARLLGGEEEAKRARREIQVLMAEGFPDRVNYHAQQLRRLPALQQRVREKIMGVPDLEGSHKRHLDKLRDGLESLKAGTDLSPGFMDELRESSANIHAVWDRASRADRIAVLKGRIERLSERLPFLHKSHQRATRELNDLMKRTEQWLNPWALEEWLEADRSISKYLP